MKLLVDLPEELGALVPLWVEEARERYRATEVFRGSSLPDDMPWAVVCTPDRIRSWKGLAPCIYSVPDRVEIIEPVLPRETWALRIVSGETATVCQKVIDKYGGLLSDIPEKAKKWHELAARAELLLSLQRANPAQLVSEHAVEARVELGEGPSPYKLCEDFQELLAKCAVAGRFSYDYEFGSDDEGDAEEDKDPSLTPVGVSLSWAPGQAEYVPLGHEGYDGNFNADEVLRTLSRGLRETKSVLWNAKADMQVELNHVGRVMLDELALFRFDNPPDDAMALCYLLSLEPLSLKKRTWIDYRHRMQPIKELIGQGKNRIPFSRVPVDKAVPYGCQDADWTLRHWNDKWPMLYDAGRTLYETIERPLTVILAHAQLRGMPFDRDKLTDMYADHMMEKARLEEMIFALAGVRWNLGSNEQTACVLYERLGLPPHKPTASFKPSVSANALFPIARNSPIIPLILRWSKLHKLESAFYVKLLSMSGDWIHCAMNQFVTDTGRLSSKDPNMQQNPASIRSAFIGAPEIMAADESQLELRIQAALSQDPGMLAAYMSDPPIDLHDQIMGLTGITERKAAKTGNFLTQYGGAAPKFQLALWKQGIYWTLRGCQDFLDAFFAARPRLRPYMAEVVEFGEEHGYSETVWGRRRYVPEIYSSKPDERGHAERQLINHPTQGTGSDKVKQAMVACWKEIVEGGAWMPLQIHDEILVLGEDLERFREGVNTAMTTPNPIAPVPLVADIKIASNWGAAH